EGEGPADGVAVGRDHRPVDDVAALGQVRRHGELDGVVDRTHRGGEGVAGGVEQADAVGGGLDGRVEGEGDDGGWGGEHVAVGGCRAEQRRVAGGRGG